MCLYVSMSVFMYVCNMIAFKSLDVESSYFGSAGTSCEDTCDNVKCVCEGHRVKVTVKVKVSGVKM